MLLQNGDVVSFLYPLSGANRLTERPTLSPRTAEVRAVRDLWLNPLDPMSVQQRPALRRSRWLINAFDLDRHEVRSFYGEAMVDISVQKREELTAQRGRKFCTTVYVVTDRHGNCHYHDTDWSAADVIARGLVATGMSVLVNAVEMVGRLA